VNILNKRTPEYIEAVEDLPTPPNTPPNGGGYTGAGGVLISLQYMSSVADSFQV
jgi:hypothetical protein